MTDTTQQNARESAAKGYDGATPKTRNEPAAFKRQCFRDGWDAAIAAIPDVAALSARVHPLVWGASHKHMGLHSGPYQIQATCGSDIQLYFGIHLLKTVERNTDGIAVLKAAAQAHHVATILAAFGVQGEHG